MATQALAVPDLVGLIAQAIRIFGSEEAASDWLMTTNPALDYRAPIEVLTLEGGPDRVRTVLARVEYSVYS